MALTLSPSEAIAASLAFACPPWALLLSPRADSVWLLQCSARCGMQGTMKREVRCSVETPLCDESRKPSSEKACTGPPCDRRWTTSDWGPVSPDCLLLLEPDAEGAGLAGESRWAVMLLLSSGFLLAEGKLKKLEQYLFLPFHAVNFH